MRGFTRNIKTIEERSKKNRTTLVADISDFDLFYEAVVKTKHQLNIINTAEAVKAMSELALKKLEEMQIAPAE